jgi:nucleoside diphosphate kinase
MAVLFVKPHAAGEPVTALVESRLAEEGIQITHKGELGYDTIDKQQLIDKHYGAIAAKATILKPHELSPSAKAQQSFKQAFGLDWSAALANGVVYNAMDASKKLNLDAATLDKKWSELKRDKDLIKFGGGFYAGKIDDVFVINGFYMAMRAKYTTSPAKIVFYVVEWATDSMHWADFRSKFIGATNPAKAETTSLRGQVYAQWESLGLAAQPDTGDNGIHASASPFEALVERMNWVNADVSNDSFGKRLLALGVPQDTVIEYSTDPQVAFSGEKSSLFDLLEDLNAEECAQKLAKAYDESPIATIRYLYGGNTNLNSGEDHSQTAEVARFLYGGSAEVEDDFTSTARFLFGADAAADHKGSTTHETTSQESMSDYDLIKFLFGGEASNVPSDDVSDLTEFLYGGSTPAPSRNNGDVEAVFVVNTEPEPSIDDVSSVARLLYGGSAEVEDDFTSTARFLFGADAAADHKGSKTHEASSLESMSDDDLIKFLFGGEASNAVDETEDIARFLFGGEAASPAAASRGGAFNPDANADDTLAAFLLGGSAQAPRDEVTELAQFLYGAGSAVAHTTNFDNSEEGTIKFLLGGEASNAVDETEDIARFLFGGEAASPAAASSAEESVSSIIDFKPDANEDDALAAFLLGGSAQATPRGDETTELAQFLYGGGTAILHSTSFDTTDEGTIKFLYGGETSNAVDTVEAVAKYLYGGEAATPSASPVVSEAEESINSVINFLYSIETKAEKCTSDECIALALSQMQAELSITDADLDQGLAWGEDMVQYCQWQSRNEASPSKMVAPPLPRDYALPPAPSVCKSVMASSHLLVHAASL